jgi:CubicO group peptidase (beta-lactamase class C family)
VIEGGRVIAPMSRTIVDPSSLGVDPSRLEMLLRRVEHEVLDGPLPSCQVAVAKDGHLVADRTYGASTPTTRYVLQSVGRIVVAAVAWKLIGDGLLRIDERVAGIIPEFATHGKGVVTVEQTLTHTGGFPLAPLGFPTMERRDSRLEAFAKWRLTYPPGERFEFHLTSAAWVIAEIVERRTGRSLAEYLAETIAQPLGLSLELGVPPAEHGTLAWPVAYDRVDDRPVDPWGPWYPVANPQILAAGEPSHSMVGTAADCVLLMQALEYSGLWDRDVVSDATRPRVRAVPTGMYAGSRVFQQGLFVAVAGDDPGDTWLPQTGSPATFGSGGAPSQLGFHDPSVGLSFAFLHNGYPVEGYEKTRRGRNLIHVLGDMAGDLVS